MKLSRNFSLNELIKSQTAVRLGIDNTPSDAEVGKLQELCRHILQPVRDHYAIPFAPSSGYRSVELCKAIGSSSKSQHAKGEAADFEVPGIDNYDLACWIRDNLDFDQLILEFYKSGEPSSGWVHCSYKFGEKNRKQCLTFDGKQYVPGFAK
jgi:zinc D-Ala-D-Ala carboxypeptidase